MVLKQEQKSYVRRYTLDVIVSWDWVRLWFQYMVDEDNSLGSHRKTHRMSVFLPSRQLKCWHWRLQSTDMLNICHINISSIVIIYHVHIDNGRLETSIHLLSQPTKVVATIWSFLCDNKIWYFWQGTGTFMSFLCGTKLGIFKRNGSQETSWGPPFQPAKLDNISGGGNFQQPSVQQQYTVCLGVLRHLCETRPCIFSQNVIWYQVCHISSFQINLKKVESYTGNSSMKWLQNPYEYL